MQLDVVNGPLVGPTCQWGEGKIPLLPPPHQRPGRDAPPGAPAAQAAHIRVTPPCCRAGRNTTLAAAVPCRLEADLGLGARRLYQVVVVRRQSVRGRGRPGASDMTPRPERAVGEVE
jgi:hypothetical protein